MRDNDFPLMLKWMTDIRVPEFCSRWDLAYTLANDIVFCYNIYDAVIWLSSPYSSSVKGNSS